MKFSPNHLAHFGSSEGAYSLVTRTEVGDSQITLTGEEANIASRYFGEKGIYHGNVTSNPEKAAKPFRLFPSGRQLELHLIFPKRDSNELRLYLSQTAGFKPDPGSVWFIFIRSAELWIGYMDEKTWRMIGSNGAIDTDDDEYQQAIQGIQLPKPKTYLKYPRNPVLAQKRFELSLYKCDADNQHPLFISRSNMHPFVEAHHFIPFQYQKIFRQPLDTLDNIFCLCPMCHRKIHYSIKEDTRALLEILEVKRPNLLNSFKLDFSDLSQLYGCENIIK